VRPDSSLVESSQPSLWWAAQANVVAEGRLSSCLRPTTRATCDPVDQDIRELLATEVLQTTIIEAALDPVVQMLRSDPGDRQQSTTAIKRRLAAVESELTNLTETAARGGAVPAVLAALNRADAERRALEAELRALRPPQIGYGVPDAPALRHTLQGYLKDWHAMVRGSVTEARQLLTTVLRSRIVFRPTTGADGRAMYELTILIAFDQLIVSIVPALEGRLSRVGGTSPTGFGKGCPSGQRSTTRPARSARHIFCARAGGVVRRIAAARHRRPPEQDGSLSPDRPRDGHRCVRRTRREFPGQAGSCRVHRAPPALF
jgi:hypothetical protein